MRLRTLLAKYSARLCRWLIQTTHQGKGETAPGLIALKIDPQFVKNTHQHLALRILISGTNGKTTTSQMVRLVLQHAKMNYVSNPTGSNLLRGLATASIDIDQQTRVVLWEVDEAALGDAAQQIQPTHVVLTNIFRDQLDRYGEVDTILTKWQQTLQRLPRTQLFLNADDPQLSYLGQGLPQHPIHYFGLDYPASKTRPDAFADAIFCPICHRLLIYRAVYYSHLGKYSCACKYTRPHLNSTATAIVQNKNGLQFNYKHSLIQVPLQGLYNVYNALATVTLATHVGIPLPIIRQSLATFVPAFGRQEHLSVAHKKVHLYLVKNPTGFNQVIETLASTRKNATLVIAINDQLADGTDISWLWDVNFESLASWVKQIIVTGDRALDLAVRLKYAKIQSSQIQIVSDLSRLKGVITALPAKHIDILPTYTALWRLRKLLTKTVL